MAMAMAGLRAARSARERNAKLARDIASRVEAEAAVQAHVQLQQSILERIEESVIVIGKDRKVLISNVAARQRIPFGAEETDPRDWSKHAYLPDGITPLPKDQNPLDRALSGLPSDGAELVIGTAQGEMRSYSVTAWPSWRDGEVIAASAIFHNSAERKNAKRELLESEQRYRVLSDASFEGVAITKSGIVLDTNENFARWLGYEPRELVGVLGLSLFAEKERERVRALSEQADAYEAEMLRRDGSTFPVEVRGRFVLFREERVRIAVVRDITEKKQREAELRAMSLRDSLTGLYNRRGFIELAEHALRGAKRISQPCALFFADLDGMKTINDELGHAAGDQALCSLAGILHRVFRSSDVITRLGGDEFAVFAPQCDHGGVAKACARLRRAIAEFNQTSEDGYVLSASTGASVWYPAHGGSLSELLRAADENMYEEKRAKRQRSPVLLRASVSS